MNLEEPRLYTNPGGKKIKILSKKRKEERYGLYEILENSGADFSLEIIDAIIDYFHKKEPMYGGGWSGASFEVRRKVYLKHAGLCNGCKRKLTMKEATLDHIVPRSMGGGDHMENLCLMCAECNVEKDNKIPSDV